jgi:ABC-2 type transport system permease protein
MFLFSGIFFPFAKLPDWAQIIGWCLPLSHFVAATRQLVLGDVGWLTAAHVAVLVGFTAAFFMLPIRRLRRSLLA